MCNHKTKDIKGGPGRATLLELEAAEADALFCFS